MEGTAGAASRIGEAWTGKRDDREWYARWGDTGTEGEPKESDWWSMFGHGPVGMLSVILR